MDELARSCQPVKRWLARALQEVLRLGWLGSAERQLQIYCKR
jgi:hypothetical protein